ncbi:MAG: hypothetical protein U1E60_00320 [Reyranellaceae bacterium]
MISEYQMGLALPMARSTGRLQKWYPSLVDAMRRYVITTPNRMTYFLANVAAETGQFQAKQENLNYTADRLIAVFPSLFAANPQKAHELVAVGPEAIANYLYADENRPSSYRMGNTQPGDGWKYRGRGPMQVTGKENYRRFFRSAGLPDDSDPDLLLEPAYGAASAAEYWSRNGCNELADTGNFVQCVIKVNGGTIDLAYREAYLKRLQEALTHPASVQSIARPTLLTSSSEAVITAEFDRTDRLPAQLEAVPPMTPVPPPGYEVTEGGNVLRKDLSESAIVKSARVGQRVAWATSIVTAAITGLQTLKEAFVNVFLGVSPLVVLVLSGVALVLTLATVVYFRSIEKRRVDMHDRGIV